VKSLDRTEPVRIGALPLNPAVDDLDGELPGYDDLLRIPQLEANYSWGVFGAEDEIGALNLLTPRRIREALVLPIEGRVIGLSLPLNEPDPPPTGRTVYTHTMYSSGRNHQDEYLDGFQPQASSQWDGFRHIKGREFGFYNGFQDDEAGPDGTRLGIEHFATRGVIARAVLLDVPLGMARLGKDYDPLCGVALDVLEIEAMLAGQGAHLRTGDVLLLNTGWLSAYRALSYDDRKEMVERRLWPGLRADETMARFLWNHHVVGVAADNPAVEVSPGSSDDGFLHRRILPLLGLLVGELWDLEELARACHELGRYESLVVSVPLNLPGGVGSPANAIAVL